MSKSRYYYDLKEHARYFPRDFRIAHIFADVTHVPDQPSIVKSRPILGNIENSVLMKLNKLRHYQFVHDKTRFEEKKSIAVWRGSAHSQKRIALVRGYHDHPLCDVKTANRKDRGGAFMSPASQMSFRYILSVEGNDVATNTKWIMASQSLCIMPQPVYETWYMEGALKQGVHYVEVRSDFEDLEEKILYYENHTNEAREIIRNANAYVAQFLDEPREHLVSLLVLYKYFALTGQLNPSARLAHLWVGNR
jgi:Glycosyl transferase family 90